MTHDTGSLDAPGDVTLFTRRWTPDRPVRAVVVVVHGIHEHSGRYAYVASTLMRRGIAVHALDLRGHGQSSGARGQIQGFDEFLDDVQTHLAEVRAQAGDLPLVLLGHSMGGLVVASYVVERGTDGLAGVVLSSPLLKVPDGTPALLLKALPVVSRWLPRAPVDRLDLSGLSRDPTVIRAYRDDELTTKQGVRARTANEMARAIARVRQRPEAFDVPLYVFHGTADTITDPVGSEWLAAHAGTDDVTLRLWEGLYHETMNEPERDEVIAALADWIEAHTDDA